MLLNIADKPALFGLFCFVGEVLTVLVRSIAPISLFCPQTVRLSLAGLSSHRVSLEIQLLTWLPQPERMAFRLQGPEGRRGSLRNLFLKDRGRAGGVIFGVNVLTAFYLTAVSPKPGREPQQ